MADWPIPAEVTQCLHTLRQAGHAAYPVGGCVRDLLLGRVPGDFDLCTSARPEQVMSLFSRTVPTGLRHGTVTVLLESGRGVEVTTFRREGGYGDGRHPDTVSFDVGLREDLARRDFTVNAMALDERGEVIDLWAGQADLRAGVIRCVGDPDRRFSEDALRMFRAIRFAAQLGFSIAPDTLSAMEHSAWRAGQVSGERIQVELEKILLSPAPERAGELVRLGLLEHLHPGQECPALDGLGHTEAAPEARWRAFCQATGFPIEALPVTRQLRRAVRHPEAGLMHRLALSGGDLAGIGYSGQTIGRIQRELALHVLEHPEDNTRPALLALVKAMDIKRE